MYYEIREQKLAYLKEKRNKEIFKAKLLIAIISVVIVISILAIILPARVDASSEALANSEKYFKSVEVNRGDTLWSIASKIFEDDYTGIHYDGINQYIEELKQMNHIKDDTIHEGSHITVTYYAPV